MGPKRKKSKPNSEEPSAAQSSASASQPPGSGSTSIEPQQGSSAEQNRSSTSTKSTIPTDAATQVSPTKSERPAARASWYSGGSWRSKASPVAQVARESISVSGGATSESSSQDAPARPGQYMNSSLKRSRKSVPLVAEATRVNVTRNNTEAAKGSEKDTQDPRPNTRGASEKKRATSPSPTEHTLVDPPLPPEPPKDGLTDLAGQQRQHTPQQSGWFGWWSRPDGYGESEKAKDASEEPSLAEQEAQSTPLPRSPVETRKDPMSVDGPQDGSKTDAEKKDAAGGRSWFGLWSASQNLQAQPEQQHREDGTSDVPEQTQLAESSATDTKPANKSAPEAVPSKPVEKGKQDPAKAASEAEEPRSQSAGWAFWSKDRTTEEAPDPAGNQKQVGQLAVADTPSQSHPEAAQFNEGSGPSSSKEKKRPDSVKLQPAKEHLKIVETKIQSASAPPTVPGTPKSEASKVDGAAKAVKGPQTRPNMVLPPFDASFTQAYVPTYWERIGQYLASSLSLSDLTSPPPSHVAITPNVPKVRNAIAIGVHGYFPAAFIQKVLGAPTGTSIKFANCAADSIRSWIEKHQPDTPCEIEQVALEGEGFIADRVTTLWKLLLNWLSHLRNADLIFIACHSQGVPVAIMLLAKLIQLGCLNPNAQIGVCAMAGVNLGPFADYKSRYIVGSAAELFEFSNPSSKVSREYTSSLEVILRHNVRVTYIGSLDDQLVSLESSLFSNLSHPYVQRAVFIDGRIHEADFIIRLVEFALKLRNQGISDHGLIRELSAPLLGSIYNGDGHSRVYDDAAVYETALRFTLETTAVDAASAPSGSESTEVSPGERGRGSGERSRSKSGIPASTSVANSIRRGSVSGSVLPGIRPVIAAYEVPISGANANPYFLPWAMRGILEEPIVKKDMQDEVDELVRLFDEWRPSSKSMKDVRFRLEAVKSKM